MNDTTLRDMIDRRLEGWGYETGGDDDETLDFLIRKTEHYIKAFCNIDEIPEELLEAEIDMIALEFLKGKAAYGGLEGSSIQITGVSSISEGDVSLSYSGTSAFTLSGIYDAAKLQFERDLMPYRRLRW